MVQIKQSAKALWDSVSSKVSNVKFGGDMNRGFKIAYAAALVAILVGGGIALMAARTSAFGAGPVDDSSTNWSTLLFGGGTTTAVITGAIQLFLNVLSKRGTGGSSPYETIFNAVLAGFDMASGKAAHSSGSHTLANGVLEWDVKFTPTQPVLAQSGQQVVPVPVANP